MACVVATVPVLIPHAVADDLNNRQHTAQKSVRAARGDLEDSSKAQVAAAARLTAAQGRLKAAQAVLATKQGQLDAAVAVDDRMQAQLAQSEHELTEAQQALTRGKTDVAAQKVAIGQLAAQNYQYGDPQLMGLVVLLKSQQPQDVTSQMNTVSNLTSREDNTLDQLQALKVKLGIQAQQVTKSTAAVAAQRKVTAAEVADKLTLEKAAATQRAAVAKLVASRRAAESVAARSKAHDQRELAKAKKQENRIKRLIMARSRHQRNRSVANTSGLLFRPVPGYVTSPYGWRIHPIYGYRSFHDGDDLHAPCGTPERAADNGTVISEYYSDVWGHRLFLDLGKINGHNFTVIYNHISSYRVHAGAHVRRGETVAYAGTTGWSTGCHLHFTVMRDGATVNPLDYM